MLYVTLGWQQARALAGLLWVPQQPPGELSLLAYIAFFHSVLGLFHFYLIYLNSKDGFPHRCSVQGSMTPLRGKAS